MTVLLIITALLFILYAVLIIYYHRGWRSIPSFFVPAANDQAGMKTRVSIIIPARNEEDNIGLCLESIIAQSYPSTLFEVIVVDDHSTDNTAAVVKNFTQQNIRLILLKDHVTGELNSYKKKAIEVAIASSTGDLIITTDADCIVPANWLRNMAAFYETRQAVFIAAPVAIDCGNNFIEIFQALDFMTLQGITGASVHSKFHSMCNGANMAYTKKAFYEVNGFNDIDDIASGDDMLLMHKISKQHPGRLFFLKSKEAIVHTQPVKTIAEFFNQRIRWASKADKYDDKSLLPVLLVVYLFNVMMLVLPIGALFNNAPYSINNVQCSILRGWASLLFFKIITELFFLFPVAKFFDKQSLLWLFPLMQPFHILYTVIAGFLGKFGTYKWKNRKVK